MTAEVRERATTGIGGKLTELLRAALGDLVKAAGERVTASVGEKVGSVTQRLTQYAEGTGNPSLMAAVTGAQKMAEGKSPASALASGGFAGVKEKVKGLFGRGGKKADKNFNRKVTNIVETVDVGVPIRVAYNQWTQFEDFPSFTKKVENVKRDGDDKTEWKAQVFWSHRSWQASIVQQVPDSCIVWRSKGQKGRVDGAVTFHELAPDLTRILVVLEYHPQGLFEQTGNIWRAQGRRARLELKHFRRHVMTRTILKPDDVEGWRGEIRDGEVVKDHDTAVEEEQKAAEEQQEQRGPRDEEAGESDEKADEGSEKAGAGDEEAGDEEAGAGDEEADEGGEEADEDDEDDGDEDRPAAGRSRETPEEESEPEPEAEPDADAERDEASQRKRRPPARPRQATQRTSRRTREDA
jgi:hypothetical protein